MSLCVASLLVIVIMLTAAKNAIAKTAFELQCSDVFCTANMLGEMGKQVVSARAKDANKLIA